MTLRLTGADRKRLREILLEAFDRAHLTRALAEASPARDLENLVAQASFSEQVFELIQRAEAEAWLPQLTGLLASELPHRNDLQQEAAELLERASEPGQPGQPDADADPLDAADPPDAEAPRPRTLRFLFLSGFLTALCITAGAFAYTLAPAVGIWAVPAALLSLLLTLIAIALGTGRRGGSGVLARGGPRIALLATLILGLAVNGLVLHRSWNDRGQPNFIVRVLESERPLARQKVDVARVTQSGRSDPAVEVTNGNGEAFFRLAVGSDRIYLGGVEVSEEDRVRRCQFPAFTLPEARSITHDLNELHCASQDGEVPTNPDPEPFALRIDATALTHRPVLSTISLPKNLTARQSRAPLGLPKAELVLDRRYYTLGYDTKLRAPRWVAFTVDAAQTLSLRRRNPPYRFDPDLPVEAQTKPDYYKDNPYDRGTLIRRADALLADGGEQAARAAEQEVFYYSVIVPQADKTNRITWAAVEDFTSKTSERVGPIHVVSGPVYPSVRLVAGSDSTPVPIALYRVLLRKDRLGRWRTLAFLVPNDGSVSRQVGDFVTTIDQVEARTGLDFLPQLPAGQAAELEAAGGLGPFVTPVMEPRPGAANPQRPLLSPQPVDRPAAPSPGSGGGPTELRLAPERVTEPVAPGGG